MKNFLLLLTVITGYSCVACATENLTEAANQFYSESISGLVQEMYLPIAEKNQQDLIIKNIQNSGYMDELKKKTWPCLSKLPQEMWDFGARKCFSPVMGELMKEISIATAEVKTGTQIDKNNPAEKMEAISIGSKIISDNAAAMHYATSLSGDIGILQVIAMAANGGMGKDISASEAKELKDHKIACGANLFAKKDGTVLVDFPKECARMEKSDEKFDISVDAVIKGMQKQAGRHNTFMCQGYKCIWKRK